MTGWRDRLLQTRNRLLVFDPAFSNLRLATRAVLTAALTVLVMHWLNAATGHSLIAALLGGAISLIAAVTLSDASRRGQLVTLSLMSLPAASALTLGALLSPWPLAADAGFVAVIFVAVYIRRYGSRGFAFGMLAFIANFFGLFLAPVPHQLPWLYLAIVVAVACAAVLRLVLLPDHPARTLQRVLTTFYALADHVLGETEQAAMAGPTDGQSWRRLRRQLSELNAAALNVESAIRALGQSPAVATMSVPSPFALFELELTIEQVAMRARQAPAAARRDVRAALIRSRRALAAVSRWRPPAMASPPTIAEAFDLERAMRALNAAIQTLAGSSLRDGRGPQVPADAPDGQGSADRASAADSLLARALVVDDVVTRQAIQAAVATALSIGAGQMLSSRRWYWAAITAFIVFTGTESRGEALSKGGQRLVGTFAGVAAGVALGTAVQGETRFQLGMIFVCIFIGFYALRKSYAVMIFWITILIAMLYSLLGFFSAELLVLRVEETAIGAAVGMAVAALLLPRSTSGVVRGASVAVFGTLAQTLESCGAVLGGAGKLDELMAQVRLLDTRYQSLRTASRPLTTATTGLFARRGARRWLRALWGCRHYVRTLVTLTRSGALPVHDGWAHVAREVALKLRTLRGDSDTGWVTGGETARTEIAEALRDVPREPAVDEAVLALQQLDRIATRLLNEIGPLRG